MIDKKLILIGRIDQIVRDYFKENNTITEIAAKDLIPLFINKGILNNDYRNGLPIRNLLRELDDEKKLSLFKNMNVICNAVNRNWNFIRS